jgi:poly(3-hydroxybutyrate) depolymerase
VNRKVIAKHGLHRPDAASQPLGTTLTYYRVMGNGMLTFIESVVGVRNDCEDIEHGGDIERRFDVRRGDRVIPGLLWLPSMESSKPMPLVLYQHGGSGHKSDASTSEAMRRLVDECGFAVAWPDSWGT